MADAIIVSGPISGTDKTLLVRDGQACLPVPGRRRRRASRRTEALVTANAAKGVRDGIDFFPLTVDVEERMYAAGRIPGSFFRREGRPTDAAILTCRLIDRPLRPSFADGFRNETQVVVTVMGCRHGEPLRRARHQRAPGRPDRSRASRSRARSAPCASPTARTAPGSPTPPTKRWRTSPPSSWSWPAGASVTTRSPS